MESGTHEELLRLDGHYRALVHAQEIGEEGVSPEKEPPIPQTDASFFLKAEASSLTSSKEKPFSADSRVVTAQPTELTNSRTAINF